MLSREVVVFNTVSLALCLGLSSVLFSYAAIPDEKRLAAEKPLAMEEFPDINLGPDYGDISVAELMGYYMENPPQKETTDVPKKQHFGGC